MYEQYHLQKPYMGNKLNENPEALFCSEGI